MAVDVQPFALLLFRHAQPNGHISQLVTDKGHNTGPDNGDRDTFQLHQHLMSHGHAFCVTHTAQRLGSKDTGHDTANDAAHTVHAEYVTRIVNAQNTFQCGNAPQPRQTCDDTDQQCTAYAHVTAGWRNTYQTGNRPGTGTQQRWLAANGPLAKYP